jgi:hypothetical protein
MREYYDSLPEPWDVALTEYGPVKEAVPSSANYICLNPQTEERLKYRRPVFAVQAREEHLHKLVRTFWLDQATSGDDDLATPIQDDILMDNISRSLKQLSSGRLQLPCLWETKQPVPCIAMMSVFTRILKQKDIYLEAYKTITTASLVDDIADSRPTTQQIGVLTNELSDFLQKHCAMYIQTSVVNDRELMLKIPHDNRMQALKEDEVVENILSGKLDQVCWLPGAINPADAATRGVTVAELRDHKNWLHGPDFLYVNQSTQRVAYGARSSNIHLR